MPKRGVIRNRKYAQQIRDFSGLCFGKITPTDIDAMIEYKNKAFIFVESKHGNAPLPYGQKLALERLCDATMAAGKKSILIISSHNANGDIDYANTRVSKYYYLSKWHAMLKARTLIEVIKGFIDKIEKEDLE